MVGERDESMGRWKEWKKKKKKKTGQEMGKAAEMRWSGEREDGGGDHKTPGNEGLWRNGEGKHKR